MSYITNNGGSGPGVWNSLNTPLASAYTLSGQFFGVNQAGPNVLLATCGDTATNNSKTALISASLPQATPWFVDFACNDATYVWNVQYPEVGVCVATGTTSGDTAYAMERYWNGTSYGWHMETFHPSSTRISINNEQSSTGLGLDMGILRFRLINDGSILHYQFGADGYFWTDWYSASTPASLAYYGFMMGNGAGSGGTGQGSALVYRNKYSTTLNVPQVSVSNATNASPIVITTSSNHNLLTGDLVAIHGVGGNTNANSGSGNNNSGNFTINVLTLTTFQLLNTTGNGTYTAATGTVTCISR